MNSFGFSMGGLIGRAIQCRPSAVVPPPLRSLVTMGGPHHGGLQRLAAWAEELIRFEVLGPFESAFSMSPRAYIDRWSPGTADLLDYETIEDNPTLFTMNETLGLCSPRERVALIGGTDSGEVPPNLPDAIADPLSGRDLVGELPNDSVVSLRSAHAEKPAGLSGAPGATVPSLARKVAATTEQDLTHFDVGKRRDDPRVERGRAQPISDFIQDDILPHLTDWTVTEVTTPLDFDPPALGEEGRIRYGVDVHFNANGKEIGAVALVFYGKDVDGNWHILDGASPQMRRATRVQPVDGNSRQSDPVQFRPPEVTLPDVDVNDPTTQIIEVTPAVLPLASSDEKVPEDPTQIPFQTPSSDL